MLVFVYIETHGGTAIGGSDDHAGINIGRTFTETPRAETPEEFLAHIRAGNVGAHGDQGQPPSGRTPRWRWRFAPWARATVKARPDPERVLMIVERVLREGNVRQGGVGGDLGPEDARALLRAWLEAMDFEADETKLLELLQSSELSHPDLYRRARGSTSASSQAPRSRSSPAKTST